MAKRDTAKFANGIRNSIATSSAISYIAPIITTNAPLTPVGTTSNTASDFMSIIIPSAGIWMIDWSVIGANLNAQSGLASVLTDNSNNVLSEPFLSVWSNTATLVYAAGYGKCFVNVLTPSTTYKIRVYNTNLTLSSTAYSSADIGRSWVSAIKVQ